MKQIAHQHLQRSHKTSAPEARSIQMKPKCIIFNNILSVEEGVENLRRNLTEKKPPGHKSIKIVTLEQWF